MRVTVDLPDPRAVLSSRRMELDMELGCPGTRDAGECCGMLTAGGMAREFFFSSLL